MEGLPTELKLHLLKFDEIYNSQLKNTNKEYNYLSQDITVIKSFLFQKGHINSQKTLKFIDNNDYDKSVSNWFCNYYKNVLLKKTIGNCLICFGDEKDDIIIQLPCHTFHIYHINCLKQFGHDKCCLCQKYFHFDFLNFIS